MPLSARQLESLNNVHGLPLGKIVCIVKAAVKAYKCVKAAGNDPGKIAACAAARVGNVLR